MARVDAGKRKSARRRAKSSGAAMSSSLRQRHGSNGLVRRQTPDVAELAKVPTRRADPVRGSRHVSDTPSAHARRQVRTGPNLQGLTLGVSEVERSLHRSAGGPVRGARLGAMAAPTGATDALDVFSPETRAWFDGTFGAPTPAQELGWPAN